jgi:hypothetical protein
MGLFNKKKKEEIPVTSSLPELPPLPKLPDLPLGSSTNLQFKPNILPRFPSSSLGNKFSQDTIKDAVSGEKEDEETDESEEIQMMPKLPSIPMSKEMPPEMDESSEGMKVSTTIKPSIMTKPSRTEYSMQRPQEKSEPIFVRIDKFEENMDLFNKIKKQLLGVEKILEDIKRTKEEEDKELELWQQRLQTMKSQIDKIDKDIFSKID